MSKNKGLKTRCQGSRHWGVNQFAKPSPPRTRRRTKDTLETKSGSCTSRGEVKSGYSPGLSGTVTCTGAVSHRQAPVRLLEFARRRQNSSKTSYAAWPRKGGTLPCIHSL